MAPKASTQTKKNVGVTKSKAVTKTHNERGSGLKFKVSSYELISRFTGQTRIQYAKNPKNKGSKSYDRYQKYQNCKTVAAALKYCKPADLLWEYERGYLKVLGGPMAEKPACFNLDSKDPTIRILSAFRGPNGNSIKMDPDVRAKLNTYAKVFGLDLDKIHMEAGKQCNSESADIQTQRVVANEMARRKLESKKKLTENDVVEIFQIWGFPENDTRMNVLPEGVKSIHSDTLGVLRMRDGTYRIFDPTIRYEHVTKLVCRWFHEVKGKDLPSDFGFTGINVNSNYAGRRHRDNNNEGPSAIKAIGKFTGGKLTYFPKDFKKAGRCKVEDLNPKESISIDLTKGITMFNGNNAHGVQPFKGNRLSFVFFTTSGFWKVQEKERNMLTSLGFKVPTVETTNKVKEACKKQDLARAQKI